MSLVQKQQTNSTQEFIKLLFRKRINDDEELHNSTRDEIEGQQIKCMYEQFCYLNGYLEKKLDDEDVIKTLKQKGFSIKIKNDATTQYYVYVYIINDVLENGAPKIPLNTFGKSSVQLFIDNCCELSKFDCDKVSLSVFQKYFEDFCN